MPNFNSLQGELTDIFVSDFELVDRYVGNQLWMWGYNVQGQLGTNDLVSKSSPVQTVSGGTNWKQVSVGRSGYSGGIKTDGTLWLWGENRTYGQLGDNTLTMKSSPVQTVSGGTNWKQIVCGFNHTAAIKTDGTLWLWGFGGAGQLGTNDAVSRSSPVQTVSAGGNWKQVSCKASYTGAIKTDGTLWLWGLNTDGQLGDNTRTMKSSPVQTVSGGSNWKIVSCGVNHTAAIKTDGTLWLWGWNSYGKLGTNNSVATSSPVQTVAGGTNWKQVSVGQEYTAAIKTDGTLWTWGSNIKGELGTNDTISYSSPVQTVSGGTNWKQVSCAYDNNLAAIKTDGTLWLWGDNQYGQLGDNTRIHRSSPVQTVFGGTNWKQVAIDQQTIAITFTES